jgi:anti-sigma-K factor RskA
MNIEDRETRLNDYVDGLLSPEAAREVEAELERDPAFRAEELALRELLTEASQLPNEIAPERDLWKDIALRMGKREGLPAVKRRTGFSALRYALLAASLAAMFLGGIYFARMNGGETTEISQTAGLYMTGEDPVADLAALNAEYANARTVLVQALDDSRDRLSPETVAVLDENLAVIAQAVGEIRAALEKDPGNQRLIRSLVAAYDQEVDLLKRASQLPAQM